MIPPTQDKPTHMYGYPGAMAPGWTLDQVMPELTRRSVRYIEKADGEPFFLYFALTAPHTPIVPSTNFHRSSDAGAYGNYVCQLDWCVGQIMSTLQQKGIADNTLLIFTSDNGPEPMPCGYVGAYNRARQFGHYSMGDMRGVKRDTWEGGHRVPFLACWPGVTPAATQCGQLTVLNDLMATCAEFLGTEVPDNAGEDSVSMLPLLQGQTDVPIRQFAVHHSCSGKFALREDDWVYIDAPSGDDNCEPQWLKEERGYTAHNQPGELFDLKEDLSQRVNRYGDHPDVVRVLSRLLTEVQHCGKATLD